MPSCSPRRACAQREAQRAYEWANEEPEQRLKRKRRKIAKRRSRLSLAVAALDQVASDFVPSQAAAAATVASLDRTDVLPWGEYLDQLLPHVDAVRARVRDFRLPGAFTSFPAGRFGLLRRCRFVNSVC